MPREWPFAVRSAAWRATCANADAQRLRIDVANAFVDRTPIDWTVLLAHAPGRERAFFESLRALDLVRHSASPARAAPDASCGPSFLAHLVIAMGAVQTAWGLGAVGIAFVSGDVVVYRTSQIAMALAFAIACLLLGAAAVRDNRRLFLLAAFAAAASAFARAALKGLAASGPAPIVFHGFVTEAFAPASFWQFAVSFPHVRRFSFFDVLARQAAGAAWLVGGVLFTVNFAIAHRLIGGGAWMLERDHPSHLFWHVFAVVMLPAVAAILERSRRAARDERRKVVRLALAIGAGTLPLLSSGILRMTLPSVNAWFASAGSPARFWVDRLIVGSLMTLPILSTMAVLIDRPFGSQVVAPRTVREWRARMATLELPGWQRAGDHPDWLIAALERVRTARGTREMCVLLRRALRSGIEATTVRVLVPQDGRVKRALVDPCLEATALNPPPDLVDMIAEATRPLDISADGPLRALVPQADGDWLAANDVALAAPLKRRDGSIAAIVICGPKRGGRVYARADCWLMAALISGAAPAWDLEDAAQAAQGGSSPVALADIDEPAFECVQCGLLSASRRLRCRCGSDAILASVPRHLSEKFAVVRRLGTGGMGVVYLARDTALDRDVALKTLPDLRDGAVARLRDEARMMAALNHESLATIYGLELWRRTPVLVVEYLEGGTLAHRLANGPLPPAAALATGVRLARALTYMHARGVLHRDLKPSNIGFTAAGAPKLLDFGLATLVRPSTSSGFASACDTGPDTLGGTPAYLPPEIFLGAPADEGADLWALSTVMLEMLTGRNPFENQISDRAIGRSVGADLAKACVRPDRLPLLIGFFERALALQSAPRFQTSVELQAALESLAGEFSDS